MDIHQLFDRITGFALLTAFCLLLAACSSEEKVEPETPSPGPGTETPDPEGEASLTLTITFPSDEASTKALTDTEEKRISNLRVFVFEAGSATADSQLSDKFLYEVANVPTPTGSGDTKTTTVALRTLVQKQRLVLVANLPASVTLSPTAGQTMAQVFNNVTFPVASWLKDGLSASDPAFPMFGQMRDSVLINASTGAITVNMFRALARVDVGVDLDNAASTLPADFKINKVYACNTHASAYLVPEGTFMQGSGITETEITIPRPAGSTRAEQSYTVASPYRELSRAVYLPESNVKDSPAGNAPAFIVVEATWKGKTGCFYRVDFAEGGSFIPVLRNHAYRINITAVNTAGYATLAEAKAAPPSGLGMDIVIEGSNNNINEIVYNGDDWLGVGVSELLFDWDKRLVGNALAASASNEYELKLFTTYASWSAAIQSPPAWLRLVDGAIEKTSITGTQSATQQSTLTIKVKEENLTGAEREATILLKAGLLEIPIKVRQSGGANSHLMRFAIGATTASMNLPVAFASKALGGTLDLTGVTARVLWHETAEDIPVTFTATLAGNYVTVSAQSTGSTLDGNAVIALVKGGGINMVGGTDASEVLWSWHIWAMGGSSDADATFHDPNTAAFMRTAMGRHASNKGMFYQWGRKDPFPQLTTQASPRVVVTEAVTADNTAAYVRQHPEVFYTTGGTSYTGWLAAGVGAALWTGGAKATYSDPCPTGWRVPSNAEKPEWTTATTLGNGYIPAATGTHTDGTEQQVWLAPGSTGSYPYWNGTGLTSTTSTNAADGRSVRCIKDISLVKK